MTEHVSQRVTDRSPCEPNVSWRLLAEVTDPRSDNPIPNVESTQSGNSARDPTRDAENRVIRS